MNDLPWSPSKRAEVWRSMFNIDDPAKRIANIYKISCQFRNLSPSSREKSKSTTGAKRWRTDVHCKELIHAVGDRSTALKVSRVADLPESMIGRSVAHVQTLKSKQLDAKKVPADKRGPRAAIALTR